MDKTKLLIGVLLIDFIALLVWAAIGEAGIIEGILAVLTDRWGLATAADLAFGLILMSILVFYNETSPAVRGVWIVSFFLLGNIGPALYLLSRLPALKRKLRVAV